LKRYGKEIKPILKHKQDFFDNNEILLTETQRSAKIYTNQPYRINCKICQAQLDNYDVSFIKQDVEYRVCNNCGHLNGIYEDTNEYAEAIYQDEEYANQYREESKKKYFQRMRDIYLPKVEFMFDTLEFRG